MQHAVVALFGESERGDFRKGYYCQSLPQLSDILGEPPTNEAKGLHLAVQALLYEHPVIFFRVAEEGFSQEDYHTGFRLLQKGEGVPKVAALCLPGVGDAEILDASDPVCALHDCILIITEQDLYDYMTS